MPRFAAPALLAALILSPSLVLAQAPAAPSGHWEGAIQVPGQEVKVELDLGVDRREVGRHRLCPLFRVSRASQCPASRSRATP